MVSMDSNQEEGKTIQCVLCFNGYDDDKVEETTSMNYSKLYKLILKYLHSALTKETSKENPLNNCKNEKALPFCRECLKSAAELSELRAKIKSYQKSFAELILMFSFGILHRREKAGISEENKENNNSDHYLKLNVSLFPECDSWMFLTPTSPMKPNEAKNVNENDLEYRISDTNDTSLIEMGNFNEVDIDTVKIEELANEVVSSEIVMANVVENSGSNLMYFNSDTLTSNTKVSNNITTNEGECHNIQKTPLVILAKIEPEILCKKTLLLEDVQSYVNLAEDHNDYGGPSQIEIEPQMIQVLESISTEVNYSLQNYPIITPTAEEQMLHIDHNTMSKNTSATIPQLNLDNMLINTSYKTQQLSVTSNKSLSERPELNRKTIHQRKVRAGVKCQFCGRLYKNKKCLLDHIKAVHRNTTTFQCTECDKSFAWKHVLIRHMVTHTGEKPHKCNNCDQRFSQRAHLNRHVGQLSCPICETKLSCRTLFRNHCNTHNVHSFNRSQCQQSSSTCSESLNIYQSDHSIKYHFKCRECEEKFKTENVAVDHYKNVHFALDFSDDCIVQTEDC